ncbi:putative receptor-like protein kinase At3g47110 [Rhododendron vialii]|uniref:putative receptor-like protein kinase At3g47110 n=1 Tax=Rhododendron vialii TaxID=182163 RepID=UPI00265F5159|nr:putative receptor-like protein kinase At3g47110 [Rhododendron vialii]
MTAHVGDFGLARFLPGAGSNSSRNQSSSIGIRGSTGYPAPEYGIGNEVSTSGDVYSYGILLLEMFIGKRPTDSLFTDGLNLHNSAKMALSEQAVNIGDPTLFQQIEKGETSLSITNIQNQSTPNDHKIKECLVLALEVGIACSKELPRDQLSMDEVVSRLHSIRNSLFETGLHRGRNG